MLTHDLTANRQAQACLNTDPSSEPSSLGLPSDSEERTVVQGIARYRRRQDRLVKRGISRQLRFKSCVVRGHCWGMLAIRSRISLRPLRARLIPPTIEEGARY